MALETDATNIEMTDYEEFAATFDSLFEPGQAAAEGDSPDGNGDGEDNASQSQQPGDGEDGAGGSEEGATDAAAEGDTGSAGGDSGVSNSGVQDANAAGTIDWQARALAYEAKLNQYAQLEQQAQQSKQASAPEPEALYTAAEVEELKALREDWPAIERLYALLARQQQHAMMEHIFTEVGKVLYPIQASVKAAETEGHLAAILDKVPDYEQVRQPVLDWVEKQPSFLKGAYQQVVRQGTAVEIADMIDRFKVETKWGQPVTPPAQKPLSEAAKKAARAMGAVGSKRTSMEAAPDPNDLNAGWDDAISGRAQ